MSEKTYQELTKSDRYAVGTYRTGLGLAALFLSLAAFLLANRVFKFQMMHFSQEIMDQLFWAMMVNFAGAVGVSIIFMHLYNQLLLRVMQVIYWVGLIVFLMTRIDPSSLNVNVGMDRGLVILTGRIGLAVVFAVFAFITAKEALSFKFTEGWVIAGLSIVLAVNLFFYNVVMPQLTFLDLAVASALTIYLFLRKIGQPMDYDIGDKSKYPG